jgi:hypothetical protein
VATDAHEIVTVVAVVSVTVTDVGTDTVGVVVTVADVVPEPEVFVAVTWYVYAVPFVKPVNM